MEQLNESSHTEKKKPGPKPKANQVTEIELLKARIHMLERCIEKTATFTGNGNILLEYGLRRWIPGKSDLSKYSN